MATSKLIWNSIKVSPNELNLAKVLKSGQAFRWKLIDDTWSCSFDKVVFLRQKACLLEYSSYPYDEKLVDFIHDYFNLGVKVEDLYRDWSDKDPVFAKSSTEFNGIRILRQDPWENLISFICSSNNNIKRISQMCENLCLHFGDFITNVDGMDYFSFPKVQALAQDGTEEKLRDLSFGYRAKYIHKTALQLIDSKINLNELRSRDYNECHAELIKFTGVGPKVADCVCLMSLDKHDSIPVDTHVYQIAKRDYKLKSKGDTIDKQTYELIRQFFVDKWGPYAGWAQSVMFTADLKSFQNEKKRVIKSESVKILVPKVEVVNEELIKEEIEYSITGRPKRRKTVKIEV